MLWTNTILYLQFIEFILKTTFNIKFYPEKKKKHLPIIITDQS